MSAVALEFDAATHTYWLNGDALPSVTQLIEMGGLVDTSFMTEASRRRGTAVHDLCTRYDLKSLAVADVRKEDPLRGYLLAYAKATEALQPTWEAIEEFAAHPTLRFAGRPDRRGTVSKFHTICEIKSGAWMRSHAVQLALQAILASASSPLPAMAYQRLCLYVKPSGKYRLERHTDRRDYDVAHDLIRRFCR